MPTLTPTITGFGPLCEIGRGGFGVVYRGQQEALRRWEAVKVLPGVSGDSEVFARFTRECQALGAVGNHPNIATVYACGFTEDGSGYLALELLEGGSLAQRGADGPLPWQEVAEIGVALSGALESAHRAGVLHRDIKPENIMFDGLQTPKLLDFGIASVPGAYQSRSSQASLTFAHAAPEVVAGARGTVASDVYSLASSLFAAVRGRPAFVRDGEDTLIPMLARIAAAPVPDLRPEGVCDDLCSVLERAMAKDPAARPASAEELGVDLAQVLSAHGGPRRIPPVVLPAAGPVAGPAAVPATSPRVQDLTVNGRPPTPASRRLLRPWLVVGMALALLLAGWAGFWLSRSQGSAGPQTLAAGSLPGALARPAASRAASPAASTVPGAGQSSPDTEATPGAGSGPVVSSGSSPAATGHNPTGSGTVVQPVNRALPAAAPAGGTVSVAATSGGAVQVLVGWSAGRAGGGQVAGYQVRRSLMSGGALLGNVLLDSSALNLTTVVPAAQSGHWYRWSVRATGPGGPSGWTTLLAQVPRVVGVHATLAAAQLRAIGMGVVVRHLKVAPTPAGRGVVYRQSLPAGTSPHAVVVLDAYLVGG